MRSVERFTIRVAGVAVVLALAVSSCEDPVGAPRDILAVSSVTDGHFHRATIPGSDIANPPSGGRTYTSTNDMGHTHTVTLTETQLLDLEQRGTVVSVTSSDASTSSLALHHHTFTFQN